jgi:AP-2 complex subunit alpha
LAQQINAVFERYHAFADVELQQRSVEYFTLAALHEPMLKDVLAEMPKFPVRTSALFKRVAAPGDLEIPESQALRLIRADPAGEMSISAFAAQRSPISSLGDLLNSSSAAAMPVRSLDASLGLSSLVPDHASVAFSCAAAPPTDLDDFFGGGAAARRRAEPVQSFRAAAVPPLQDPQLWLRKLAVADSGVLYEDAYLQLGVKAEFRLWAGRATLFVGNKHLAPLVGLRATLTQAPGLRLTRADLPASVGDRQQASVQLSAACTAPFAQPPSLTLVYTLSDTLQEVTFTTRLPFWSSKFLVKPPAMEPHQFYAAWRALSGPHKLEAVIRVKAELAAGGLPSWSTLLEGLRISVLPGVDPNPQNLFAVAALADESGGNTLVITRLESDVRSTSQFRITVASVSAALVAAVHGQVVALSEAS